MNNSSSSILSANQSAVAQFWLEGVLTPAVSLAGVVGNTVCILVLTTKRADLGLKPSFIDLLTMLVKQTFSVVTTLQTEFSSSFRLFATYSS